MEVLSVASSLGRWILYIVVPFVLVRAAYKLFFHPLRDYPGPLLGKLTDSYSAYWAFRESFHLETYRNLQKYGPVIRQSPNRLVFNTLTAVNDIYLNPVANKGQAYSAAMVQTKYPSLIICVNRAMHRRKRKLISPALSDRTIREIQPSMKKHIDIFLRQLLASTEDATKDATIADLSELTKRLGVDVIGQLAFGYDFQTQEKTEYRNTPSIIEFLGWRLNIYMQFPALNMLEYLVILARLEELNKFGKVVKQVVKGRMAESTNAHHDLYSIIMKNNSLEGAKNDFKSGELWPESIFLLSAGGLTTATAMSATFFYLSRNPECYAALANEVRSVFASDSEICMGSQLSECKYLRACIDEAMRMSPPFLPVSWRELDKDEAGPFIVDGHVIPRGTSVGISPYSLLHNEEYFPEPFKYKPERWLAPKDREETPIEKEQRTTMNNAFIPFMAGDRNCPGKVMAYTEASLTIARTLWFFDFEVAKGEKGRIGGGDAGKWNEAGRRPEEYQLGDIIVTSHEGPNLVFKKRGDFWKDL